ncbi:hypothetical protein FisN_19Lh243 [Fistulifera solaris]|uniref:DUF4461 domain-containing protein n=1 Tax=Fistulifera solaris TaxID=1519565 RepID=A0A1Z5K7B8_FISSO|nr:hypothetical protein FisN_19Lh243 [Fistulifera solaris]|eukprot:GAX22183.1 hypothetical protein FisN_19Lh243 [Fistulifera solaris]
MSRSNTVRSVYMARVRRAFLLRVHPDRFRSPSIRSQQARLVQALSNRMNQSDFTAWQQQQQESVTPTFLLNQDDNTTYPFVLEKRDGSFFRTELQMNASVDVILSTILHGLKQVGALLPDPPKGHPIRKTTTTTTRRNTTPLHETMESHTYNNHPSPSFHPKGRSLSDFLSNLQPNEISTRRNSRIDAQAAALAVRRLYRFQAVDATSLGWSSAWVATLFRRLLDLHHYHHHSQPFKVHSFYPIRLVFSNAAAKVSILQRPDHALDVYGGVLRLSPASTSMQWLEALASVTSERIEEIQYHQSQMLAYSKTIHSVLGVKVKKGHSCSNVEYFSFLERLSHQLLPLENDVSRSTTLQLSTSFPHFSKTPMVMMIEASTLCRRPIVTTEGQLRLGAAMNTTTVLRAMTELSPVARQRRDEHEVFREQQKEWIQQAQYQLGLQHVYATGTVSFTDFNTSLERLIVNGQVGQHLAGHSLGITGADRFCHLADDGSLVIPHNWV